MSEIENFIRYILIELKPYLKEDRYGKKAKKELDKKENPSINEPKEN